MAYLTKSIAYLSIFAKTLPNNVQQGYPYVFIQICSNCTQSATKLKPLVFIQFYFKKIPKMQQPCVFIKFCPKMQQVNILVYLSNFAQILPESATRL